MQIVLGKHGSVRRSSYIELDCMTVWRKKSRFDVRFTFVRIFML